MNWPTFAPYCTPEESVAVRLFEEPIGGGTQWCIDGIDGNGFYTEAVWSFDTETEAREAVGEFCAAHGIPADLPIVGSGL